ncbi:DUF664 domain-containing protein [Allorhizocola rhizosphaerae]|uniref:mycothiol transferase n=1 Tax=Allorhizocola rhizosphaerae TaxID=1872709 RepID=UPI000E3E376B|nr:DUF664 domain-containing protein [Allorhizocola rhizosphaerae]
MTPEISALLHRLNEQRRHVLGILDGLDDATLHRPALPTGWTCLGLVQHLTLDVERFWFRTIIAGHTVDQPAGAWHVPPDTPAHHILDRYRHEATLADAILTSTPLDDPPARWPDNHGWKAHTNREVVLHVLTETACHAGHLDAARELIDHRQWLVLD